VTTPVTARAEGLEPPRMSCMKNESVWCWSTPFIGAATEVAGRSGGRVDETGD